MIRLALAATLLLAAPAEAHKLKLFAAAEGAVIVGTAYFSGGDAARGLTGRVLAPDGAEIATFNTGEDGGFRIEALSRMDHTLSVDGGDGHVASTTVAAAELPRSLPASPLSGMVMSPPAAPSAAADMPVAATDAIEAAVARQIRPLRQQLDAYEDKVRLHDLIGGVGTIFGLFGIYAWVSARRRSR